MNMPWHSFNAWATAWIAAGWAHFVQLTVLAAILLVIDLSLGRRLGPAWRCALWSLFFVKLVLPPGLALPTSPFYWGASMVERSDATVTSLATVDPRPAVSANGDWAGEVSARWPVGEEERRSTTDSAPARGLGVAGVGVAAWAAGMLVFATLTGWWHRRLRRLLRCGEPAPASLEAALARACASVGVTGRVRLRLSAVPLAPLVTGLRRPVIHLPRALVDRLSPGQLHTVLVHELYHVKRYDLWMAAGQNLARVVFFHHPVLWWVNARLARLREQATDRAVLSHPEIDRRAYSLALLETAAFVAASSGRSPFALGVIENKSQLHERITMNLQPSRTGRAQLGFSGFVSIVLLGLLLLPMMAAKPGGADPGLAPSAAFNVVDATALAARVDRASQAIYDAFNRRDRDAFLGAFVGDPIIAPDRSGLLSGRGGVADMYLRSPAGMQYAGADWSQRTLYDLGDWIADVGTIGFKFRLNIDAPVMTDPRFVVSLWQKSGVDELKVKLLAWNQLPDASWLDRKSPTKAFACTPAGATRPESSGFAEVLATEERFHQAFEIQDLDTAAGYYAEGATLSPPRTHARYGREAIAEYLHALPPEQRARRIEREVAHVAGDENHVLVVNLFRWTFLISEEEVPVHMVGKGVHLWERGTDGAWRILFDLPNASQSTG